MISASCEYTCRLSHFWWGDCRRTLGLRAKDDRGGLWQPFGIPGTKFKGIKSLKSTSVPHLKPKAQIATDEHRWIKTHLIWSKDGRGGLWQPSASDRPERHFATSAGSDAPAGLDAGYSARFQNPLFRQDPLSRQDLLSRQDILSRQGPPVWAEVPVEADYLHDIGVKCHK